MLSVAAVAAVVNRRRCCESSSPVSVLQTLTGRKATFDFEGANTVSCVCMFAVRALVWGEANFARVHPLQILQVKTLLQEKEGITVAQIRLIHNGKQLADDKTLDSYGIAGGATLHMVLALRGGAQ